ncbi:MAG: 5'-nucleotidase C-terminal domain-containing protein [bacterium]|nr:5'-nucleotidase C-terminal domain-containing protein [bacterium]
MSKKFFNRLVVTLVIVLLFLSLVPSLSFSTDAFSITILHTNDTHSHIEEIARRVTLIRQVQKEVGRNKVLLLDAGDVFSGTPYFTIYKGSADVRFMNYAGYDAMTLGNHEFDMGPNVLARFIEKAKFPILCANFDFSKEDALKDKVKSWVIVEKGGEKFGVFGLTTPETAEISSPGKNIAINDYLETAKIIVKELESRGINKIIALSHIGWDNDVRLAKEVEGIDIIVGGHSHTLPKSYPTVVADDNTPTLIVQANEYGKYLGRLDVIFNNAGIIQSWKGNLIAIDSKIKEESLCKIKLEDYKKPVTKLMNTVVGESLIDLDGERSRVRSQETNLANLVTDAMLAKAKVVNAVIAIQNGGGIRASIPKGKITLGQIMTVLPFGNYLVTLDLTGQQIIEALENGVSQVKDLAGRFPQVSGLRFVWDPNADVGKRIVSVEIKNPDGTYQPIDPTRTYRVVTNNFLAQGGDGYTVFQKGTNFINLGFVDYDVLREYIQKNSPINPQIEGRIIKK